MLEIINHSCFSTGLYPGYDSEGERQLTCVIKAAWNFDSKGVLKRMRAPPAIVEVDRYFKEPNQSSLIAVHEIMPYKKGSEILLYGTAQPNCNNSVAMEVSIKIEWTNKTTWQKKLYVFGPREWQSILLGFIPGKPQILNSLPLRYEYAYGGRDLKGARNFYAANPAGMGFTESSGYKNLLLPQIENQPFISKISDRPTPAGFGPIPLSWQFPKSKNNKPLVTTNVAPPDQRFTNLFLGGEKITFNKIVITLPKTKPTIHLYCDEAMYEINADCDTAILDADAKTLQMIWRSGIPWKVDDKEGVVLVREKC